MTLIDRIKELLAGDPVAEALVLQAEQEALAGGLPEALPVIVEDGRVALDVDPVAPLSRNVTLRAAYDKALQV